MSAPATDVGGQAQAVRAAIVGGGWIPGGLSAGGSMFALDASTRPIDQLPGAGLAALVPYVQPLQDALDRLTGRAAVVQSYSDSWQQVSAAVGQVRDELARSAPADTASWVGDAADSYRSHAADLAASLGGAATLFATMGTAATLVGSVVADAKTKVTDLLTGLVRELISYTTQAKAAEGGLTPNVLAQATRMINAYATPIGDLERQLRQAMTNLKPHLGSDDGGGATLVRVASLDRSIGPTEANAGAGAAVLWWLLRLLLRELLKRVPLPEPQPIPPVPFPAPPRPLPPLPRPPQKPPEPGTPPRTEPGTPPVPPIGTPPIPQPGTPPDGPPPEKPPDTGTPPQAVPPLGTPPQQQPGSPPAQQPGTVPQETPPGTAPSGTPPTGTPPEKPPQNVPPGAVPPPPSPQTPPATPPTLGDPPKDTPKSFDDLPPDKQEELVHDLTEDSSKGQPLSQVNAEAMLRDGPAGTTPTVARKGGEGADVQFKDADGNVVLRREGKSVIGGPNSFNSRLSDGAAQVRYDGEVWVQLPDGTTRQDAADLTRYFQDRRTDQRLGDYAGVDVVIRDESGQQLGRHNLGTRLPTR
ncbi:WXG100 family type VII secretion target [Actinocrispum wychmicini]|uniref:WXG100 family type VII secretion target n=1 Tax=Actinocrispum wychmicini TaxID=1213861 RepID=A0A4R2J445_9PSEU|nr:hypothetical protein [Actinocrispum wychmicini]TCO52477.1 hypothetical protein EV192_112209 [Actinocrispum wychmicini]